MYSIRILLCVKFTEIYQLIYLFVLGGLGGEKARWSELAAMLKAALYNAIGDVLLSAGVVAYMGAFTVDFRNVSSNFSIFFLIYPLYLFIIVYFIKFLSDVFIF